MEIEDLLNNVKVNNWAGSPEDTEEVLSECTHIESYSNGKNEFLHYVDGDPYYSGISAQVVIPEGIYPINFKINFTQ
jgi:hypothetical protein